jgi:hypothetical protein
MLHEREVMTRASGYTVEPGYLDLKTLAAYSSCSIRWLRDRLVDRVSPLPHHRVGGKILVRKEDFDDWMRAFRRIEPVAELDTLVDDVVAGLLAKKAG